MRKTIKTLVTVFELLKNYPVSLFGGFRRKALFKDIKTYCMFIGYPRSGHSLIGALLDAHPNIIIAHELGELKYLLAKYSKNQLFYLLLKKSQFYAEHQKSRGGYRCDIPGQWHGKFEKLRVIGDKHGEGAVLRLQKRPWLLSQLRKTVGISVKFIHVIRNPYDSISTICKKAASHALKPDLMECIEYYFFLCETVVSIQERVESADIFELRYESFLVNPQDHLKRLCLFLGVEPSVEYLNDCANTVFKTPHKSRYEAKWNNELIEMVKNKIKEFSFLNGYSYVD